MADPSANRTQMLDVHTIPFPENKLESKITVQGTYEYWHYGCDGLDDRGWGCGYRTLQTICSWIRHLNLANNHETRPVPSIPEIQASLVKMQDKPESMLGSREWIGTYEACLIIDELFKVPSKIVHIPTGKDLEKHFSTIKEHFEKHGSPIMMGGDHDASSKGIFGTCETQQGKFLLIVDPHYWGPERSKIELAGNDWVNWRELKTFMDSSFYNLCLPQTGKYTN